MGSVARVTIAGRVVAGGHYGAHSWPLRLGTQAPEVVWALDPDTAAVVLALDETEIRFEPPDAPPLVIKRVVVVKEAPSDDPLIRNVVLSDLRWYWPRRLIQRIYNMRTKSGTNILTAVTGVPQGILPIYEQTTFAPPTLKGDGPGVLGQPWKANEIVIDVLNAVMSRRVFAIHDEMRPRPNLIPNNLSVVGRGDAAVAQVLGAIGGVDIRVNPDASVTLLNSSLGAEKETIDKAVTYSLADKGTMRWVNMTHVAPRRIDVHYELDMEVRADGWEPDDRIFFLAEGDVNPNPRWAPTQGPGADVPWVQSVITVTDQTLPLRSRAVAGGTTLVQGMAAPLSDWVKGVEAQNDRINLGASGPGAGPLTPVVAADLWFGPLLNTQYVTFLEQEPDQLWASRVAAFRNDWRSLWQLNPRFARRIMPGTIRAVRAGLLDPISGTRAPSIVYEDFCRRPSLRGLRTEKAAGWNAKMIPGLIPDGDPQKPGPFRFYDDGNGFPVEVFPLNATKPAPVSLKVEDPVTGTFRVAFVADPEGKTADYTHGLVQDLPGTSRVDSVFGGHPATWELAKRIYTHRIAFIFSCVPIGPNNEAALKKYSVLAPAALSALGVSIDTVNAKGPAFSVKVGPGITRARCAWSDALREQILNLFVNTGRVAPTDDLIPVNDSELLEYAQATAASMMANFLNHYEGGAEIGWSPGVLPIGSLTTVAHGVDEHGAFYTALSCNPSVPPVQPEHFLSASSRATLLRLIGQSSV